jgi:hypothetical protein
MRELRATARGSATPGKDPRGSFDAVPSRSCGGDQVSGVRSAAGVRAARSAREGIADRAARNAERAREIFRSAPTRAAGWDVAGTHRRSRRRARGTEGREWWGEPSCSWVDRSRACVRACGIGDEFRVPRLDATKVVAARGRFAPRAAGKNTPVMGSSNGRCDAQACTTTRTRTPPPGARRERARRTVRPPPLLTLLGATTLATTIWTRTSARRTSLPPAAMSPPRSPLLVRGRVRRAYVRWKRCSPRTSARSALAPPSS